MTNRTAFLALSLLAFAPAALPLPLLQAGRALAAEGFVEGFDELPLMPGLFSVREESLTFDKPAGRIVQAEARGAVSVEAVRKFYHETVPQLGWRKGAGDRFVRDGEALLLEFVSAPADAAGRPQITVRFLLTPE
ncbi:MAG: hypothetical protein WCO00_05100 [Rhodospirillaceae bacterium]